MFSLESREGKQYGTDKMVSSNKDRKVNVCKNISSENGREGQLSVLHTKNEKKL